MGQAPATHKNSLRTTPRNFPGRSGTKEDRVFLCSPEIAAASALYGEITDPRTLDMDYPKVGEPDEPTVDFRLLQEPLPYEEAKNIKIEKGPNIATLPEMEELPDRIEVPVLLKLGDNFSTDEILAGGARVLPYRSNLPEISKFSFEITDEDYYNRAMAIKDDTGHAIIGGSNYGQGSSREHAALAPRYLGLRVALVQDFARIHWQNLVNFGVLPITFEDAEDYMKIDAGDTIVLENLRENIQNHNTFEAAIKNKNETITVRHEMSRRQIDMMLRGGLINWVRAKQ
jgi:aconitate hydratase